MSVLTATGVRMLTAPVAVSSGSANTYGAWVEVTASTASDLWLSHVLLVSTATGDKRVYVDLGVGGSGSEVVVATVPCALVLNVGMGQSAPLPLLVPVPSGSRLAVRVADDRPVTAYSCALGYYAGLESTVDNLSAAVLAAAPAAATGFLTVTSGSSSWANGAWVEAISALSSGGAIVGVAVSTVAAWNKNYEIDIGVGTSGAETVIGTVRGGGGGYSIYGGLGVLWLPSPYLLASTTRVAVRARAASTSAIGGYVALAYYGEFPVSEFPVSDPSVFEPLEEEFEPGQSFGPLIWVEVVGPDDTVYAWAPVTLADPSTYYHGYKAPKLLGVGRVARALSDELGQYESQRFSVSLDDTERQWRTWLGDIDTRLVLNKRVTVRMISEEAWRQKLRPRTVALGLIRDYRLE